MSQVFWTMLRIMVFNVRPSWPQNNVTAIPTCWNTQNHVCLSCVDRVEFWAVVGHLKAGLLVLACSTLSWGFDWMICKSLKLQVTFSNVHYLFTAQNLLETSWTGCIQPQSIKNYNINLSIKVPSWIRKESMILVEGLKMRAPQAEKLVPVSILRLLLTSKQHPWVNANVTFNVKVRQGCLLQS